MKKRKTTEDYLKTIYMLSSKGEVRGKEIAKDVLERNTVFRRLLLSLGVDKETAANDACEMEHAVSSKSFEALKQMIGKETKCERNG